MTTNSEAPVSVSTTAYYKGFSMQITKRDPDVKHERLLEEQIKMIDWLIGNGFKPSWNDETNKANLGQDAPVAPATTQTEANEPPHPAEEGDSHFCNLHGQAMVLKYSKTKVNKDGSPKPYWSHSNNGELCFGGK